MTNSHTYTVASLGGVGYLIEKAYDDCLSMLALGETLSKAYAHLVDSFPELTPKDRGSILANVRRDGLDLFEAEDISDTWKAA